MWHGDLDNEGVMRHEKWAKQEEEEEKDGTWESTETLTLISKDLTFI